MRKPAEKKRKARKPRAGRAAPTHVDVTAERLRAALARPGSLAPAHISTSQTLRAWVANIRALKQLP